MDAERLDKILEFILTEEMKYSNSNKNLLKRDLFPE
jgi:hypothetical protein